MHEGPGFNPKNYLPTPKRSQNVIVPIGITKSFILTALVEMGLYKESL